MQCRQDIVSLAESNINLYAVSVECDEGIKLDILMVPLGCEQEESMSQRS